jgi:hypothetical protein
LPPRYPEQMLIEIVDGLRAMGPHNAPPAARRLLDMIEAGEDYMSALDRTDQATVLELHRYVRANRPPLTAQEQWILEYDEAKRAR